MTSMNGPEETPQEQGQVLATRLTELAPQLSANQMTYLAHLAGCGGVGEAAKRTEVKSSTVRWWRRQIPGFKEAEGLAQRAGADFGVQIARRLFATNSGVAAGQILGIMEDGQHGRDRLRAAGYVLDRTMPAPSRSPMVPIQINVGVNIVTSQEELQRQLQDQRQSDDGVVEGEATEVEE